MPKIFRDVIQGTPEWAQLRCGVPTASQFHRIVTPGGRPSKSAEMYRFELIAERLLGEPTVGFTSHWMDRGSELEAQAVCFFEFTRDCETEKIGFILNDAGTIGASPDRLVGENELLEIKVGKPATQVGYLLQSGTAYEEYKIQAMAQLWVAERDVNHLLAYNPGLPPALYSATRDEKFIKAIAFEVEAFSELLEKDYQVCIDRGYVQQMERKPRSSQDDLLRALKESLIEVSK